MPGLTFEREVTRDAVWLRALFMGPTGAGKSKGALELATRLAKIFETAPPTLINTEKGRGKLYADRFQFGGYIALEDAESQGPDTMIAAFDIAERENPGAPIVLDSASHEWMGRDGVLQRADRFGDWKTVRPQHQAFVDRVLSLECHLIVCVRAKMDYMVTEEETPRGKRQVIQPVGLGPVQDKDFQYEFNLVGRFDLETHRVRFSGHVDPLVDTEHDLVGEDDQGADADQVAQTLSKWLAMGNPIEAPPTAEPEKVAELRASLDAEGYSPEQIEKGFARARRANRGQLHPDYVAAAIVDSRKRLDGKRAPAGDDAPDAPAGDDPAGDAAS